MPVAVPGRGRAGFLRLVAVAPLPGTRVARTLLAQEHERVVAGVVAVPPVDLDGVVADEREVYHARLLGGQRRVGIEPAGHAGLAAAVCAGAHPAQQLRVVAGPVAVRPLDPERA